MSISGVQGLASAGSSDQAPRRSLPSDYSEVPGLPNGVGRRHGTSRAEPFDRWFRYPAGFASDTLAELFDRAELRVGDTVVDPFAGAGTVGTSSAARGLRFFGIEAHPLVAELARLKLTIPTTEVSLLPAATSLVYRAKSDARNIDEELLAKEALLVRRCFSPEVLRDLIAIRDALCAFSPETPWMKWALLGTLRDVASVKVGWPYQRPSQPRKPRIGDVFGRFTQRVAWMTDDLESASAAPSRFGAPGQVDASSDPELDHQVICGDSRDSESWTKAEESAACFSSPPYLNNFDYADATRLELYFLGEVTTWARMCSEVRANMLIATTQQTRVALSEAAWSELKDSGIYEELRKIQDLLCEQRSERPRRGKEYDRVLPCYFAGLAEVFSNLSKTLRTGACCYWVVGDSAPYGIYVNTPELIARLAEESGLRMLEDIAVRRRGARWASNGTRHKVPLAERLLIMRRI
jgi:hypothetical protein